MSANPSTTSLLVAAIVGCGCHQQLAQPQSAPPVARGTNALVELLVEQLVSPVPAKYPSGEWERLNVTNSMENGFIHPRVEKARGQLVAMGTQIYPTLADHINDDRYSYSGIYAAWVNHSVGSMLADIMSEGIEPHVGGYKSRSNPSGNNMPPSFAQMVSEVGGYGKYAIHAKNLTKEQLRKEYLEWHIAKERSYGFTGRDQEEEVLGPYLKLSQKH